jgi:SAM-dependent methyltransferase
VYGPQFFDYIETHAARSARVIVPLVVQALSVASVVDVGCGTGAWLSAYRACGVNDAIGIDGAYLDRRRLLMPSRAFHALDVAVPFDLGRTFDLVQSLEVAEHLPRDSGPAHVANLTRHAPCVLFSAAVPGQGGTHHTNERAPEYWRRLFATHGFHPYDYIRPQVRTQPEVASWYANNTILYVDDQRVARLPHAVRRTRVPDGVDIPVVWPAAYRVRVPWAVNQLHWHRRQVYDRLLKSGARRRSAEIAALGGGRADLASLAQAHRQAIVEATRVATELASAAAVRVDADALARMLEAVSLAADLAERHGRLTRPLGPAGFEALAGLPVRAPTGREQPRPVGGAREAPRATADEERRGADERRAAEARHQAAIARAESALASARRDQIRAKAAWDAACSRVVDAELALAHVRQADDDAE